VAKVIGLIGVAGRWPVAEEDCLAFLPDTIRVERIRDH